MAAKKQIPETTIFEVETAELHQPIGIGGILGALKTISAAKLPGLKMSWTPMGLLVERKGKRAMIPSANVAIALFKE